MLDGGAGADVIKGGAGNDTYLVDDVGDAITENASEGTDGVQASVTYTLAGNVENLVLTGIAAINGTGNSLANSLTGNSAANVLDGGTGVDTMAGGLGDDTYIVDNTSDVVTEAASAGADLIKASVTYSASTNVENLMLTGTGAINATGNTLNNALTGNTGANTLMGGAGNDTLDGGAGNDLLHGGDTVSGAGNDTYLFGSGYGSDTITDVDSTAGNTDLALFGSGIANDQLWFRHVGNSLEVSIIGTTDKITVSNWYSGSANHVEQFKTADGKLLLDTAVENLVTAMAGFSPPAAGQTTLPPAYQTALAPVLAANWH